jgi:hypothetical protein
MYDFEVQNVVNLNRNLRESTYCLQRFKVPSKATPHQQGSTPDVSCLRQVPVK